MMQFFKANSYIDFKSYDKNNDGSISSNELQILFIASGNEGAVSMSAPNAWAHQSSFSSGVSVDGVFVMKSGSGNYSIFGERHSSNKTATIGIIVHELSHAIFNLPDLYDIDKSSAGIGYFGLMGFGVWGKKNSTSQPGSSPTHMCAWSKIESGFISPKIISSNNKNIEINGTSTSKYGILKIQTNNPKEYFLLENRSSGGYDDGLSVLRGLFGGPYQGGLAIWHIDENQRRSDNGDNNDENHKLVDLEEASNAGMDNNSDYGGPL